MIRVKEGFERRVGGTVSLRFGGERVKFGILLDCEGFLPRLSGGTPDLGVDFEKEALRVNGGFEFDSVESAVDAPDVLGLFGKFVEFLLLPPNKVL